MLKLVACPVYGCPERANNPERLRGNFMYRHWKSNMVILQEVPEPMSRCNQCGIHIPAALLMKHRWTSRCEKAMEILLRQRDIEMAERCGDMELRL